MHFHPDNASSLATEKGGQFPRFHPDRKKDTNQPPFINLLLRSLPTEWAPCFQENDGKEEGLLESSTVQCLGPIHFKWATKFLKPFIRGVICYAPRGNLTPNCPHHSMFNFALGVKVRESGQVSQVSVSSSVQRSAVLTMVRPHRFEFVMREERPFLRKWT